MRIVNPLYDQAFKYLMENNKLAKKMLSVIIEKDIINLQAQPQETTLTVDNEEIKLHRFDFKAIIATESGEHYTSLVEVQKSRYPDPFNRFRRYLGINYIKKQEYIDKDGKEQKKHLPIISIYILEYNLGRHKEYDTPLILVENQVINGLTKKKINHKHKFIQLLSHPMRIVQIGRLKKIRETKLEQMLMFFDQTCKTKDKYILEIKAQDIKKEFNEMAKYLAELTYDEELIRNLAYQKDYEKYLRNQNIEKEELRRQKEEAIIREKKERRQKEEAMIREEESNSSLKKVIIMLIGTGKKIPEIAVMLDKTENYIKKIIS